MGRFRTSWNLIKNSLSVIRQNRRLLFIPAIELLFIVIIGLFFIAPFVLSDTAHVPTDTFHWKDLAGVGTRNTIFDIIGFARFAVLYLLSMFSVTFFNVVLYHEIIHALNGNGVSIARGFKAARSKIKLILIWSLFAGIVGIIIRTVEERLGFVGRWIMSLIGIAWSVASIFVIPVMIREEKSSNPLKLLKTSALILKNKWGETVIGFAGIGSAFFLGFLISIPLFIIVLAFVGSAFPETWVIVMMFLLYIIFLFPFGYLTGIARHVYCGALYVYASEGVIPFPFDEEMMNRAWKVKKVRKG